MTSFDDRLGEITFLARSETRARIIRDLHRNGPTEARALRRRFDCDRTTLQRNLDALVEHGWVQHTNGTYQITQAGDLLASELLDFLDKVGTAMELQPFLRWMPDDPIDFDPWYFADAEIVISDSSDPYAPVTRHVEKMKQAEYYRCLLPAVGLQPMSIARDCVVQGHKHEAVLDPDVMETIQNNPEYVEVLDDMCQSDRCEIFVADQPIQFHLGLMTDTVQIGVEDDTGTPRALVETNEDIVRAWAEDIFNEYKQQASPLDQDPHPESELPS